MAIFPLFKTRKQDKAMQDDFLSMLYWAREYPVDRNPTFLGIINTIASTIATLEVAPYQRNKSGSYRAYSHPFSWLMTHPNLNETHSVFLYRFVSHYLQYGNAYHFIDRNSSGYATILRPLYPSLMNVQHNISSNLNPIYYYDSTPIDASNILHTFNPQFYDGIMGHGAIEYARDIIALDTALLMYIDKYFRNSIGKRVFFEIPNSIAGEYNKMVKDDPKRLEFEAFKNRLKNNPAEADIFLEGMKLHTLDFTPNSESDIASLKDRTEHEIAKLFNFPYFMLDGTYGNNLVQQSQTYYQRCILPICDIISEKLDTLFPSNDSPFMNFRFDYTNLLSPDIKTLYDMARTGVAGSIITINEARQLVGKDASTVQNSDTLLKLANLIPIDSISAQELPK